MISLSSIAVATGASMVIHALHNQPLDPTTVYLLTFLVGVVIGDKSTPNGNGNGTKVP